MHCSSNPYRSFHRILIMLSLGKITSISYMVRIICSQSYLLKTKQLSWYSFFFLIISSLKIFKLSSESWKEIKQLNSYLFSVSSNKDYSVGLYVPPVDGLCFLWKALCSNKKLSFHFLQQEALFCLISYPSLITIIYAYYQC